MTAWPTLSEERRDVFAQDIATAREALERLTATTVYASGGIPASEARMALRCVDRIEGWLGRL